MKKYNIAFVPKYNKNFVSLTEGITIYSAGYCLGKKSIPHVTICQFYYDENQINSLWGNLGRIFEKTTIELTFKKFSDISFDNKLYWISMIPEEIEELHTIYEIVSNYVKSTRNDPYDPHLTLLNYINTQNKFYKKEFLNKSIFIQEKFHLALGQSDEIGQLTNILGVL